MVNSAKLVSLKSVACGVLLPVSLTLAQGAYAQEVVEEAAPGASETSNYSDTAVSAEQSSEVSEAAVAEVSMESTEASPEVSDYSDSSSEETGSWFRNLDFNVGGFVRLEGAYSTGSDNPFNQGGDPYNGVSVRRQAGDPFTGFGPIAANSNFVNTLRTLPLVGPLLDAIPIVNGTLPLSDTISRPVPKDSNDFNLFYIRGELEGAFRFTDNLSLIGRVRGIYDPGIYEDFDGRSSFGPGGPTIGGDAALYRGKRPNYFEYRVEGDSSPNPLEWAGDNYQLYFPTLILQYHQGPLNIRAGNQQIAWGQALFFRVFDVVNGLDLRRHTVLDNAQEEFSDKRVPSLGLRIGYQVNESFLLDAFGQKFQPTIYGNPNTQYNVIPSQFTIHDLYAQDGYDSKINYGIRLKGDFGQFGMQAMAVRRYNPDGVFRWTQSGVNHNLPTSNLLGLAENLVNNGLTPNPITGQVGTTGELLAQTPFEAVSTGVWSADEWFNYAGMVRLNGITALNSAIEEFGPSTTSLLAFPAGSYEAAHNELDTFFMAAGGAMRGHLAREYFAENVFGLGASYVTEGDPGSILDQLIINVEASYTPNRVFTNPSLSKKYLKQDAFLGALVLEKYQRFSEAFPATYMVLQYMYRNKDDLFGRSLEGYGGSVDRAATGVNGAHYVAFAFQQPFPQQIWRLDFAALYDPRGGLLVQPGVKWKPAGEWTVEMFYSFIDTVHGNPNDNALSTLDFADELSLRLSYQF